MAARWKLVQSLIREATEDEVFEPVADMATVYQKLRTVQRGAYTLATSQSGQVLVSSTVGDTAFTFTMPPGFETAELMEAVETALQLLEGKTVDQARALLLRRVKNTRADWSRLLTT